VIDGAGALELSAVAVATAAGVAAAVEGLFRLPLARAVRETAGVSRRALRVMRAGAISDHWKERALPRYAGIVLCRSSEAGLYLLVILAMFTLVYVAFGALFGLPPDALGRWMMVPAVQGFALAVGVAFGMVRKKAVDG